jgi:hypothetical protein
MRPSSAAARRPQGIPRLAATLAALLLAPAAAGAANYWVGNAGVAPCTHATLQAAIDTAVGGAGEDTIYLVGAGPLTGPFTAFGGGFTLVGNVASCGSIQSVGYSTVRAASGSRPLTILMGSAETLRLQKVTITTNDGTYNGDGGCIWFAGSSPASRLELLLAEVTDCTSLGDGGGVYVSGGSVAVFTGGVVAANAANRGGGIAAANGAVVEIRSGSVLGNTALLDGGGIHAPDARVVIEGMQATEVAFNLAGRDGGGLYLGGDDENVVTARPGAPPARIHDNQAQRGGGIFVDESFLRLDYARLDHNQAAGEGGALYVGNDSGLVSNGFDTPPSTVGGYPLLEANGAGEGAALYLDGGSAILASGRIRDHHAGAGGAVLAQVAHGVLFLHGVTFDANVVPALFGFENATLLWLEHLSISGNAVGGMVRWRGATSEMILYASVLDETEPLFASFEAPSTPPTIACVVSRYSSPFAVVPAGTALDVTFADPQFVAPPGDLHLRHTSPAIDRCGEGTRFDLDGDVRAYDDRYHPNGDQQTADAGVDETTVLFADGVEVGSLVAWNGVSP